jgi:hypothetical protein
MKKKNLSESIMMRLKESDNIDEIRDYIIENLSEFVEGYPEYIDIRDTIANYLDGKVKSSFVKETDEEYNEITEEYGQPIDDVYCNAEELIEKFLDMLSEKDIKKVYKGLKEYIDFDDIDLEESKSNKCNSKTKTLKEHSYEDSIIAEIEDALTSYGLDVVRFTDAGVLSNNLGWCVSSSEGEIQLTCSGTYLSESKKHCK